MKLIGPKKISTTTLQRIAFVSENLESLLNYSGNSNRKIKRVVIETTGVCDVTSVTWRYVFCDTSDQSVYFSKTLW